MEGLLDSINNFFISQRQKILFVFNVVYALIILFVGIAFGVFHSHSYLYAYIYQIGSVCGQASLITYILTLLPGIGERFELRNRALAILRIYRRYMGILMYLFAFTHIAFVKIFFLDSILGVLPQGASEMMGATAFIILLSLFITSNNKSLSSLRIWWYRIQRLTYLAMFFIFLHVAFIRINFWSVLVGVVVILEMVSFIVGYKKTHSLTGGKPN